jgi:xanthine dehydrogenase accessory factor
MQALRILVAGSGDVGSAIAHALFGAGHSVVLQDRDRPMTLRRGMAFSDAAFDGQSSLAGVLAKRCASSDALSAMLQCGRALPLLPGEIGHATEIVQPHLLIDARMRKRSIPPMLRERATLTIGIGPGFQCGDHVDLVVESQWGPRLGQVLDRGGAEDLAGEPRPVGGVGRERFVYAPRDGIFRTGVEIGTRVAIDEVIGHLDELPIRAPLPGVLRGLVHDDVVVYAGVKLIEIDAGSQPQCFGLGARASAIAEGVLVAVRRAAPA